MQNKIGSNWYTLSKNRNAIYGIAVFFLIIYHYTSIYSYYPDYTRPIWAEWYNRIIGSVGVELFLFLSGVSLFFSWKNNNDYFRFMSKRIKKIIPCYLFVSILFWIIECCLFKAIDLKDVIGNVFFATFFQKGETRFWYVCAILIFYSLYPLIHKFLFHNKVTRSSVAPLILMQILLLIGLIFYSNSSAFQKTQIAVTRLPIFILGCYYGERVFNKSNVNAIEIIISIIGILLKLLFSFSQVSMLTNRYLAFLFAYAICTLSCVLLKKVTEQKHILHMLLSTTGKLSYEIYLVHVAVIKLVIDYGLLAIDYAIYALIILFSVIIAILISKITRMIKYKTICQIISRKPCLTIFFVIFIIKTLLNVSLTTISVPSDEFNTISVAARILGLHWEDALTTPGYYGYAAIICYIPCFWLANFHHNSYLLYQSLLLVNTFMISLYGVVVFKIIQILEKDHSDKKSHIIVALISAFLPQLFAVSQLTQNESIYSLCHVLVIYSVLMCIRTQKVVDRSLYSLSSCAFSMFAFAGNNRGAIILIALIFSVVIIFILARQWIVDPAIFVLGMTLAFILHRKILYPYFRSFFPTDSYNEDAGIITSRIPRILTNLTDLKACLVTFIGWLFSFNASTYGIGLIALLTLGFGVIIYLRHDTYVHDRFIIEKGFVNIFLTIWLLGTTALCIIGFLDSLQGILQFNTSIKFNPKRVDKLFYFRYYIALAPFAISYVLINTKTVIKKISSLKYFCQYSFLFLLFFKAIAIKIDKLQYAPTSTALIGLFLDNYTKDLRYGTVISWRFILIFVVSLLIGTYFLKAIKEDRLHIFISIFLTIEIITCGSYTYSYMQPRTEYHRDIVGQDIIDCVEDLTENDIFIDNKKYAYIYQFMLPYKHVSYDFFNQNTLILANNNAALYPDYTVVYSNDNYCVMKR